MIFRPTTTEKFDVQTKLERNVGLLRLFPGIAADTVSPSLVTFEVNACMEPSAGPVREMSDSICRYLC